MRLFFATDIHGSDICFRKFLRAPSFYAADVLLLGGDFSSKGLVVCCRTAKGWHTIGHEPKVDFVTRSEFERFRTECANRGWLVHELQDNDSVSNVVGPDILKEYMESELRALLRRWTEEAERLLKATNHHIYFIPGNDDPLLCDEFFRSPPFVPVDGKHVRISENLAVLGIGGSNPTPWNTLREFTEQQLEDLINSSVSPDLISVPTILFAHSPPWKSGLDKAPLLNRDLTYATVLGAASESPIGSRSVREAIERMQPLLGLFGHAHDSKGYARIGQTLCINPGSTYYAGRLQGCAITIKNNRVHDFQLTEG
jgi:uncharacterized protein